MNRRKVLFIVPLPPPVHGSSMVCLQIRQSALLNGAFEMDFVNLSTSRRMEEIDKRSWGLLLRKAGRFAASYLLTLWRLATRRYDLCYLAITCHGVGFLKDAPFVLLCKLFGRRVVIHQHNKGMAQDVDRPIYRWLLPMVYRHTRVILLSWRLYPDIERVVKREQVMICANGIEDDGQVGQRDRYRDPVKRVTVPVPLTHSDPTDPPTPRVLFLSNLIPSKGVLALLDALKLLTERGCPVACDFVGGETKEIDAARFDREVEARGLKGIARYHGKRYGEEKLAYLRGADLFVFPTFYENECFPLVILEAMQQGLPVISTNEGAIPDEVVDGVTGLVVEPRDVVALADAMERLLRDETLRRQMGRAGRKRYEALFTAKGFEQQMKRCLGEAW